MRSRAWRKTRVARRGFFVAGVLLLHTGAAHASEPAAALLREVAGFGTRELAAIDQRPVIKQLEVAEPGREYALVGAIRIAAPRAVFVDAFRDPDALLAEESIDRGGRLASPPRPQDVADLALPDSDLEVLASCRVAACKFKLPKPQIDWMAQRDWSSASAEHEATARIRRMLLEYAERYAREGRKALMVYADKPEPMAVEGGVDHVLRGAHGFLRPEPALTRYLGAFPDDPPEEVESFLYWSLAAYGYRPVTSLNQAFVYRSQAPPDETIVFAQKQLYASHYFLARLELSTLYDASTANGASTVLVYLDRALFDDTLGWAKRKALAYSARVALEKRLGQQRERLERRYRAARAALQPRND